MTEYKKYDVKSVEPQQATSEEVDAVVAAIYEDLLQQDAEAKPEDESKSPSSSGQSESRSGPESRRNAEAAVTASGIAGGEVARRGIADARMRAEVIKVARRVASKKMANLTDPQVVAELAAKPGFRRSVAGHLHEQLDASDLKKINDLRQKLGLSGSRILELYPEHNRPGLDGVYKGARKAGQAKFAQHKLTNSEQQLKKAASKTHKCVRGKTELVVGRGTKVSEQSAQGLKGVRQAGRSVKEVGKLIEKAADPSKANLAGAEAAKKLTAKAGGGAALLGAGVSVAFDLKGAVNGEKTAGEVAENAAWAGGEAAVTTLASAGATAATASTVAAGTAALAGSSIAGTTAMAAGLATLGPIGIGIGVGFGVGFGVKKIRSALRD